MEAPIERTWLIKALRIVPIQVLAGIIVVKPGGGIVFLVGEPVIGDRGPGVLVIMTEGLVGPILGAVENNSIPHASDGDTALNKTVEIFYFTSVEVYIAAAIQLKGAV